MAIRDYPRGESFVDDQGRLTRRAQQYIIDNTATVNTTEETVQALEASPSSISKAVSLIDELGKRIESLEGVMHQTPVTQLTVETEEIQALDNSAASIAELTNRIEQLEALL